MPTAVTSSAELERALRNLQAAKLPWARLPLAERIALLDRLPEDLHAVEQPWVAAALAARGAQPGSPAESEEWFSFSVIYRQLRYLRKSLSQIAAKGRPQMPGKLCWKTAGQWTVDVFPQTLADRLALPGIRAEVRARDNFNGDLPETAAFYQQAEPQGGLCLVLGAGNVNALPAGDLLHKLFVEGKVVLLKLNPVNAYLDEWMQLAFGALIEPGYLQIVQGGADVGGELAAHPAVDEVHVTGSARTYAALQGIGKPLSAELGNVSPVIVVPGPWSTGDVRKQAAKYATSLVANAGFNCVTPRVFIQMEGWAQRQAFNQALVDYLRGVPTRRAWYPGAAERQAAFVQKYPQAQQIGGAGQGELPWTYIPGLDSEAKDGTAFRQEAFCGLAVETALPAENPIDFLHKAVQFANQHLWGDLAATIVVHPKSLQDPLMEAAVQQAITDLRYGTVVVNHWGALAFYLALTPWGAAPGNTPADIQSGVGMVSNPLMFAQPEKSVVQAPFLSFPDPYLAQSRRSYAYFRADARYQHRPNAGNLLRLLWAALRS
ncbi:MAG: aldehyde dehydrogenase [Anaerolineales bacterium]|nr:aldehyde dehydrogenase [Anaerolineales bacterium]MCW5854608.1 aldehyde dehydrogenase [Anaerolineales bacterium]